MAVSAATSLRWPGARALTRTPVLAPIALGLLIGLSLLILATLTIPVAWAFARSLFGARAGWIAAVLFALNPFLTRYAQETRMYALVVLLGLVSVACFVGAFALGRSRRWTIAFAVAHVALLWTHNWGLFLGAGLAAGWA